MPKYDLAGNPLPEENAPAMPPTDLAGNPLPGGAPDAPVLTNLVASPFTYAAPPNPQSTLPGTRAPIVQTPPAVNTKTLQIAASITAGIVVLLLIFFLHAAKPVRVTAPTGFVAYSSTDKTFDCEGPVGWEIESAGVPGSEKGGVVFKKDGAKIDITSDMAGSFMGDIVRTTPAMGAEPEKTPVQKLHAMYKKGIAADFDGYTEMPMQSFQSHLGEASLSEWTANGGMINGKLHGYRVTMLGHERAIIVICQCPDADWNTLNSTFTHVINSLTESAG